MLTITVSPKYQVVIPSEIRRSLHIKPGQKFQAIQLENRIELVPLHPIKQARGFLKGMNTTIKREKERL